MGSLVEVLAVAIPLVGVIVWLVRIEGRVNSHDLMHLEQIKRHEELRCDLSYIRDRIDRALSGGPR